MTLPSSTYRIQFRDGMTFDRAVEIVPYLKRLGISHLYASPIFTATSGSTHGYDVTNANEIDPAIGGRDGFDRLSAALKSAGIGILIDIVPNHMAASLENPWWRSVVEWGESSRFAHHFDIDWSRKLTLPILGKPLDEAVDDGELRLAADAEAGTLAIAYYDQLIPLHPSSYALLPQFPGSADVLAEAGQATAAHEAYFHHAMISKLKGKPQEVDKALEQLSADRPLLRRVLDAQPWQLLYWKEAPRSLSYRRFFEVTGLVGLRVEDPAVFDDSHQLVLDLVRSGAVDGLRLDHIDGLADPAAYLDRLRLAVGDETYIVVEKILAEGEYLPRAWPISGTTGYEFITAMPDALIVSDGMAKLTAAYKEISAPEPGFAEGARAVKAMMARKNFAVETNNLLKLLLAAAKVEGTEPPDEATLEPALVSLLVACPIYRTYGTAAGLGVTDNALWQSIVATAATSEGAPDGDALDFINHLFCGTVPDGARDISETFRRRFQQLTGPLTAKSIEDTMFYRYNRALALNEVGGEPAAQEFALADFHDAMTERARTQPAGISTTSTHDTKRGEDARARLYALSEAPDVWCTAVARWQAMNTDAIARLEDGPAPEPRLEWMLYQALAGVWPADLPREAPVPAELESRFIAYIEKALREAKQRTNWGEENAVYEEAVKTFASRILSGESIGFLTDFRETLQPFVRAGLFNGLAQTLIKLVAPGIPDIYQGAEQLDFSLVDPDNRRMPDYDRLSRDLSAPAMAKDNISLAAGIVKQHLVAKGLALRHAEPAVFAEGSYLPVKAIGDRAGQVVSFARRHGNKLVIAVAPRFLHDLREDQWPCGSYWGGGAIVLPDQGKTWTLRSVLDNRTFQASNRLDLAKLLQDQSVALLVSQP